MLGKLLGPSDVEKSFQMLLSLSKLDHFKVKKYYNLKEAMQLKSPQKNLHWTDYYWYKVTPMNQTLVIMTVNCEVNKRIEATLCH